MKKMYAGARLRRLREERNLSQSALAKALELSPSYVNQLENDQRPLTVPVLLKLNAEFDLDVQFFASDSDARLVADVHHALAETSESGDVSLAEVDELVARMPAVGRTLVMLHRRLHAATEQLGPVLDAVVRRTSVRCVTRTDALRGSSGLLLRPKESHRRSGRRCRADVPGQRIVRGRSGFATGTTTSRSARRHRDDPYRRTRQARPQALLRSEQVGPHTRPSSVGRTTRVPDRNAVGLLHAGRRDRFPCRRG